MKQLSVLLFLLFFYCFSVFSQDSTNAESILDKSAAKIKAAKGINVSFSLTQKDKQNKVVSTSKGVMKIKSSKYYISQQGNEIFCNGVQIWNYDGQNEVTVTKVHNDEDEFSPQQILTGFNKKDFNIKLVSSTGTNYQLQLTPVDKRQNFKQIMLYINKSTSLVSKASIIDKMNAVTEISFTNISLNASFADSEFIFDGAKHPGVEVINN